MKNRKRKIKIQGVRAGARSNKHSSRLFGSSKALRKRSMRKATNVAAEGMKVLSNNPFDARGLTKRDAEFVSNILKGMSKQDAMLFASKAIGVEMTARSAGVIAGEVLQKPQVDSAIVQALEQAGIDDAKIADKLAEGLDATAFTQTGLEHSDFKTRLGYINTILKVKGQIGPDTENRNQILNYQSFKDEE